MKFIQLSTRRDSRRRQPSAFRRVLLAAVAIVCASGQASHAVTVTNLSSDTTVFADDFESGRVSASIGAWTRIGPSVDAISSTAPPAPGPAEGAFYTSVFRNSNTNGQGDLVGALSQAQATMGDVVRLSFMLYVPSDGVLYRAGAFLSDGDFTNFRARVLIDGAGNVLADGPGAVRTDTGIDYVPDTWQRWELTYVVGSSSFSVRVGNASASGFAAPSAGQVSIVGFGNGSTVPGAFYLDAAPVPEPANGALLLAGLGLLVGHRLRRQPSHFGDPT